MEELLKLLEPNINVLKNSDGEIIFARDILKELLKEK